MTYAIVTFGCRVNTADSLVLEAALLRAGATPAPAERADVVVVNTCSVTAAADQGARQAIRRIARGNPAARLVVTGCYATRSPGHLASLPGVTGVVAHGAGQAAAVLAASVQPPSATDGAQLGADGAEGPCGGLIRPGLAGRTVWTVAVQTGCDQACSYCVVPGTRGPGRSLKIDDACQRIRQAADRGFREVVLAGVHLGSYGRDLRPARSLTDLLRAATQAAAGGRVRLRLSSIEPMDCTDDLLEVVAGTACVAPHLHVPLQHASDRVLAAMRRPYTLQHYARVVDGVRRRLPNAAIGADVMVGFPGEEESDVDALCAYLEASPLTSLHVFPYSERPGTAATTFSGKVNGAVARDRAARVRAIAAGLQNRFERAQIGLEHEALTLEDGTVALTGNYCRIRISPGHARNEWVRVRVRAGGGVLTGDVVG
jgi:threonylcarbamoyladenosine tRNA methylthiotransferase MtaB